MGQQTLHTPKGFQPISPQTHQSFGMPQMSQMQLPALMRSNSMPDLLSNPPPHPSQFQFSRSYTANQSVLPQANQQMMSAPGTPTITPSLSANPTLLNVANGVIPGVEAGLYWYHPQIDKSAVLLPVVIGDMNNANANMNMQQSQQQMQQQAAFASYQNAIQQIAIQQQLQQK